MKCHPFQGKLSGVELTTGLNQTKTLKGNLSVSTKKEQKDP